MHHFKISIQHYFNNVVKFLKLLGEAKQKVMWFYIEHLKKKKEVFLIIYTTGSVENPTGGILNEAIISWTRAKLIVVLFRNAVKKNYRIGSLCTAGNSVFKQLQPPVSVWCHMYLMRSEWRLETLFFPMLFPVTTTLTPADHVNVVPGWYITPQEAWIC